MVNHPAPWRNVRTILPYNTATAPVFPLHPWARYNLEQYVPSSQTYSLPVYPTRQYSTYLITNILTSGVPTRQYSTYLVHKYTHFRCTLHASTVCTLQQTYSLPVYPTRQYSTYLVHKYTHFRCTLHASTVRTLFTNILTSGVFYTPVQ